MFKAYKWYIPFTYTTKTLNNFKFESKPIWLTPNQNESISF